MTQKTKLSATATGRPRRTDAPPFVPYSGAVPLTKTRRWRRIATAIGLGIVAAGGSAAIIGCSLSAPRYEGAPSDHFDGEQFVNQRPRENAGFGAFLKWQLTGKRGDWRGDEKAAPGPPPPARVQGRDMRVTFVNHATTLLQTSGVNVLTDPIWSDRASPFTWVGPRRRRPPGIRFEDLPPIDAVVVSHNHYDHMDLETLRRLAAAHRPRIFVGLGNGALLGAAGIDNVTELDWWQAARLTESVEIVGVPAQHFSGRGLCDGDGTLWLGYVVRGLGGVAYFAGDTGMGPHFAQIRQRIGAPRLAVLPIGAYQPEWFMESVHISPAQAVAAHEQLGAATSVGMHFGTFALADDGEDDPVTALGAAMNHGPRGAARFWVLGFGEGRLVP